MFNRRYDSSKISQKRFDCAEQTRREETSKATDHLRRICESAMNSSQGSQDDSNNYGYGNGGSGTTRANEHPFERRGAPTSHNQDEGQGNHPSSIGTKELPTNTLDFSDAEGADLLVKNFRAEIYDCVHLLRPSPSQRGLSTQQSEQPWHQQAFENMQNRLSPAELNRRDEGHISRSQAEESFSPTVSMDKGKERATYDEHQKVGHVAHISNRSALDYVLPKEHLTKLVDEVITTKRSNVRFNSCTFLEQLGISGVKKSVAIADEDFGAYKDYLGTMRDILEKVEIFDKVYYSLYSMQEKQKFARRAHNRVANMSEERKEANRAINRVANMSEERLNKKREKERVANMPEERLKRRSSSHKKY